MSRRSIETYEALWETVRSWLKDGHAVTHEVQVDWPGGFKSLADESGALLELAALCFSTAARKQEEGNDQ